jgi:nicotinamide-nucleotide amidase
MAGLEPVIAGMVARLGRGVVGLDDHGPEHQVLRVLGERGLTLGIVESMTAGAVCARIARVPGASRTLRGGLVVYATDVKMSVAGVDETILDQHGPVSKEVSRELAVAGRTRLGADIGLAVVGVAGPTTQGGKPVGRVHLCVATQGGEAVHRQLELGNRERGDILDFSVSTAIEFLRRTLAE